MSTYYPKPKIEVSLTTHADVDGVPIWTANFSQWPFGGEKQNPDWLPEDKTIDEVLWNNTAVREGDELVIEPMHPEGGEDEVRIHKDNLEIVEGPDEFGEIPTHEDYE